MSKVKRYDAEIDPDSPESSPCPEMVEIGADDWVSHDDYEKLEDALKYFVKRVEEGSIRSKVTYKMFKELLNEQ